MKRAESNDTESMVVDALAFLAFVLLAMAVAFLTSSKVHAEPRAARAALSAPLATTAPGSADCESSICTLSCSAF